MAGCLSIFDALSTFVHVPQLLMIKTRSRCNFTLLCPLRCSANGVMQIHSIAVWYLYINPYQRQ
jgi:hypothetical protein